MASREVTENGAHHEVSLTETVSTIFQKRIRALKKKVRNVEEIEKKVQEGKTINEQQEEAIRNKNITLCMIEEVERLRKTVEDEVQAKEKAMEREITKLEREAERRKKKLEKQEKRQHQQQQEPQRKEREVPPKASAKPEAVAAAPGPDLDAAIEKLLKVFYFGRLFDTSSGALAHYERAAYLGYDRLLKEGPMPQMTQKHLDDLSAFAFHLSSRPMNQLLSHKQALDHCTALAKEFVGANGKSKFPLADGTVCDLEAMLERVERTGFYSIVPTLQSFEDFNNPPMNHQQQQQQQQQPSDQGAHSGANANALVAPAATQEVLPLAEMDSNQEINGLGAPIQGARGPKGSGKPSGGAAGGKGAAPAHHRAKDRAGRRAGEGERANNGKPSNSRRQRINRRSQPKQTRPVEAGL